MFATSCSFIARNLAALRICLVTAIILMAACATMTTAWAKHSTTVILIHNVTELQNIQNNLSGNYQLANDFDASGANFVPIGDANARFTGTLDGHGFAIRSLSIHSNLPLVGLFGEMDAFSVVKNLRLIAVNVQATLPSDCSYQAVPWCAVGSVAGVDLGAILSTYVQGSIYAKGPQAGDFYVGGIAGITFPGSGISCVCLTQANVAVQASIVGSGTGYIGGALNGGAADSYNAALGPVTAINKSTTGGRFAIGGFAGAIWNTLGGPNFAAGRVKGTNLTGGEEDRAGGFLGSLTLTTGQLWQSFASGDVTSSGSVGGFAGSLDGGSGTQWGLFATGRVTATGQGYAGGLAGISCVSLDQSYSVGRVESARGVVGGLIGNTCGTGPTNSYWDLNASGIHDPSMGCGNMSNCPGVTGLTTKQMTDGTLTNFVNFDPNAWLPSVKKNGAYPFYPSLWVLSFPLVDFPLHDYTLQTVPINSVFDHSMQPQIDNSGNPHVMYACDNAVDAFSGAMGRREWGYDFNTCINHPGYKNESGTIFVLNGYTYNGAGTPQYLNYDGHPGFDYSASFDPVYAAADGTLFYPWEAVGMTRAGKPLGAYCFFHVLAEAPDAGPTYRLYYLHLSTHWASTAQGSTPQCNAADGDTDGTTGVMFDLQPGCHYIRSNGTEMQQSDLDRRLPLPEGTHVNAGCVVAVSGDAGTLDKGGRTHPHLHFELQQMVPTGALNLDPKLSAYFQCFDEKKHKTRDSARLCVPADPYGWTGAGTDAWQSLTGIPSRRFWAQ